ncbi:MAG: FtsX-like permease family protein [Oscillospiraceae bacterium]|nr:FtsX-like permease family protein [Oscillospiraceae bacterium]
MKVIGALICILVVILLSGMIIEENRRSISTLEVLGYRSQEIRRLVLSPNHLLVGFALGIPLGLALADMIARANAASGGVMMSISLTGKTLLISAVFIAAAYALSLALSARKLKKDRHGGMPQGRAE